MDLFGLLRYEKRYRMSTDGEQEHREKLKVECSRIRIAFSTMNILENAIISSFDVGVY